MSEQSDKHGPEQSLMCEMGLTSHNIERRKMIVGLSPDDLKRIASLRDLVMRDIDEFTTAFFSHLSGLEEAKALFTTPDQDGRSHLEARRISDRVHSSSAVGSRHPPIAG